MSPMWKVKSKNLETIGTVTHTHTHTSTIRRYKKLVSIQNTKNSNKNQNCTKKYTFSYYNYVNLFNVKLYRKTKTTINVE